MFFEHSRNSRLASIQPLAVVAIIASLLHALGFAASAKAQTSTIPYPNSGRYNPTTYSFVATTGGNVVGYFAGSDASFDNKIGLLVNGVLTTAGYGLDDHTSSIGQSFDFGHVNQGDSLVFDLDIISEGAHVYSDPSLNVPYDSQGETVGHNHVYSSSYTDTSPTFGSAPAGTYVAFEDQSFPNSDYSYADENFVFTNVTSVSAAAPEPSSIASLMFGGTGVFMFTIRRVHRRNLPWHRNVWRDSVA